MADNKWAVELSGSEADLKVWEWSLPPGFDPWVERTGPRTLLHAAAFSRAASAEEVEECAAPLVRLLSGAIALEQGRTDVKFGGVIERKPDGGFIVYAKAEIHTRSRMFARAEVIRADGSVDPPSPTLIQGRAARAATDDLLADALRFFGGEQDWFDIYKVIESLAKKYGGEHKLLALGWVPPRTKKVRETANFYRHIPKPTPVQNAATLQEARSVVGHLLVGAFQNP